LPSGPYRFTHCCVIEERELSERSTPCALRCTQPGRKAVAAQREGLVGAGWSKSIPLSLPGSAGMEKRKRPRMKGRLIHRADRGRSGLERIPSAPGRRGCRLSAAPRRPNGQGLGWKREPQSHTRRGLDTARLARGASHGRARSGRSLIVHDFGLSRRRAIIAGLIGRSFAVES